MIKAHGITKLFTNGTKKTEALDSVNLHVREQEILVIIGPSGCGKSTLLSILAGLEKATSGTVSYGQNSRPAVVFQQEALFPWLTAIENVAVALELSGKNKKEQRDRSRELLNSVGLGQFADHRISELSGGMKQRVQIARALAMESPILLLDEPFAALDEITRFRLDRELAELAIREKRTVVMVTHSLDEALVLGDRIAVMRKHPGRICCEMTIDIPHPRDPLNPEIIPLKSKLREMLLDAYGSEIE